MKIPQFIKPIFEVTILGAETLAGRNNGHGNKRPLLGRFQYSDGHVEEVREQGRYNLLMKVPDVYLLSETREVNITDITGLDIGDPITDSDIPRTIIRDGCKWYLYDYRFGLNLARYEMRKYNYQN